MHRRSTILALFWPEHDKQHARWALNQALRYLRSALGPDLLLSRGAEEVGVDPQVIQCDALSFEAACDDGRWQTALQLYRGELLEGLHVPGCLEFEHWLEEERASLRRLASRAAWALTDQMEARGELVAAADCARRAIRLTPDDETGARRLIQLLDRAGNRGGAVQAYEEHARWLRDELDVAPAPETQALISRVRSRTEACAAVPAPVQPAPVSEAPAQQNLDGLPQMSPWISRPARVLRHVAVLLGATGLIFGAVMLWTLWGRSSSASAPRSIAVLPCTSTVQDMENRFLGGAITEDLIAELAKSGLFEKVIAPQLVTPYRGTTKRPHEIGAELGVDALVYCDYRQSGTKERVRVHLIDGRTTGVLWTDHIEHDVSLTGGATLPVLVADGLSLAIGPARSERRRPDSGAPPTRDLRALNLYREGRYFLNQMTEGALRQSIYRFNEAIARDSLFALPQLGLSRAYHTLGQAYGSLDPREAFPLMRQAALRALALDDGLAEAHALLGEYELAFGWDWTAAERRLRKAVRLDPYNSQALQSLAYYLALVGRYDEVAQLDGRAIDMSPADPAVWANAARHYVLAGRFDDAVPLLDKGLELASNSPPLLLIRGLLYAEMGETSRGVEYLRRADSISGGQDIIRGRLGYVYALAGDSAAAREVLRDLKRRAAESRLPAKTATAIAVVHIGLGQRDSAFAWLDVAYQHRSANLVHVLRTPAGWRLASDPRYGALLGRLGLRPAVLTPLVATRPPS
ncbi:MAG: hypothetical protein HY701_10110 [Gemmatimonadetes bacterium]|nr:hypothetical protein [Gemmatimonadota bacterium]